MASSLTRLRNYQTAKRRVPAFLRSSDEWYTPPEIVKALGVFDLDPSTSPLAPRHARKQYFAEHNGLAQQWAGRVWLNPPFSDARPWINKLREHGNGIALVFARTDARWFQEAITAAGCVFLMHGRIPFHRPNSAERSRCPLGCVLIPFGPNNLIAIAKSGLRGVLLNLALTRAI